MLRWSKRHPYRILATGFLLGLLVGVGMLVGALATMATHGRPLAFTEPFIHATATDSTETFAMATGQVADGIEGVFFLDFLTGELQCWVLNRRTGRLGGQFKHNVVGDLGIEQGKKPRYLMVTGLAPFSRGTSGMSPADSVVYVADANTGNFAAYALPWNRQAAAKNTPQTSPIALIGKGQTRQLDLRGQ